MSFSRKRVPQPLSSERDGERAGYGVMVKIITCAADCNHEHVCSALAAEAARVACPTCAEWEKVIAEHLLVFDNIESSITGGEDVEIAGLIFRRVFLSAADLRAVRAALAR